ncbi:serine/threonine-protein kinase rio2-like [Pseudochaenichthys georgianus]|uniref:serine/threonine-protein kinase rio2-like n=1 Tax=Pseudochaenichthys georgianus TaxID=52239 RepID=UPI00146DA365|nr:pheromone-processing carboxypeptidase KEX1-like [Pseudochaenichthys georgianus]
MMKMYLLLGVIGAAVMLSRGQNDDDDDDDDYDEDDDDDDDDDEDYDDDDEDDLFYNGENHYNVTGNLTGNLTFQPPWLDDDEPSGDNSGGNNAPSSSFTANPLWLVVVLLVPFKSSCSIIHDKFFRCLLCLLSSPISLC